MIFFVWQTEHALIFRYNHNFTRPCSRVYMAQMTSLASRYEKGLTSPKHVARDHRQGSAQLNSSWNGNSASLHTDILTGTNFTNAEITSAATLSP
jgi:hypothetical protein